MKTKNSATIKIVIFILITIFVFLGPAYRQVFGGKNKIFRNWVMWSGKGIGLYDLRLYKINNSGEKIFINYKEELKIKGSFGKNRRLKRLTNKNDVRKITKLICNKKYGSDIRMDLRLAKKDGWKTVYDKETNICSNHEKIFF